MVFCMTAKEGALFHRARSPIEIYGQFSVLVTLVTKLYWHSILGIVFFRRDTEWLILDQMA
jgi:hypothetical protein